MASNRMNATTAALDPCFLSVAGMSPLDECSCTGVFSSWALDRIFRGYTHCMCLHKGLEAWKETYLCLECTMYLSREYVLVRYHFVLFTFTHTQMGRLTD